MEDKNLNMKKGMNSKTAEELRKEQVERDMKKIRAIMQQRLRKSNTETEESLKRKEEEQKAKVEALRQKLQREKHAQDIRDMADRNAMEQKATMMASEIKAREDQKAKETGKTSNFDPEKKQEQMMNAFDIQRSKANARNLMESEVDLWIAEDDLKEIKAAQDRMKEVEKDMQKLRAEQIKKLEEEKKKKTSAIQNIFKKLTSWPKRKIPTQEELNSDGLREEAATVNSVENNKDIQEERAKETLEISEDIPYMDKEKVIQTQEPSKQKLNYQEKNLQELRNVGMQHGITQEQINEISRAAKESYKTQSEKPKIRKPNIARTLGRAIQHYTSNLSNAQEMQALLSRENGRKNNVMQQRYGGYQANHNQAFQNYLQKAQANKGKEDEKYIGPEYV